MYKYIQPHDFSDVGWFLAPVVTTNNKTRANIIKQRMRLLARYRRVLVFVWDLPVSHPRWEYLTDAERAAVYDANPELQGRFVQGCPCMELKNLAVPAGT